MAETIFEALPAGTRILEFEIERAIGHGGFSIVYLALDHSLGRRVALKEYLPSAFAFRRDATTIVPRSSQHRATFDAGMRSFIQEARLLAQFEHAALVKVFRFWEANGSAYMAMGYYEGPTLRELLKRAAPRVSEALLKSLLASLLDAVQLLHEKNCFHRDIAPDNIIVQADGTPVLLDFGAARRIIGDMTQALTAVLKPGYAPVEQYAEDGGLSQGPWTDIYALSATLYDAITGRPPPAAVARAFRDDMLRLTDASTDGFSIEFLRGIDAGLAVRPEDRPKSIAEFRAALGLLPCEPLADPASSVRRSARLPSVERGPPVGETRPAPSERVSEMRAADGQAPMAVEPVQGSPDDDDEPTIISRSVNRDVANIEGSDANGFGTSGGRKTGTGAVTGSTKEPDDQARSSVAPSPRAEPVEVGSTFDSKTVRLRREHAPRVSSMRRVPAAIAVMALAAVGAGALYLVVHVAGDRPAVEATAEPERPSVASSAPAPTPIPKATSPSTPGPVSAPAPTPIPKATSPSTPGPVSTPAPTPIPKATSPSTPGPISTPTPTSTPPAVPPGDGRVPSGTPPAPVPEASPKPSTPGAPIVAGGNVPGKAAGEMRAPGKIRPQEAQTSAIDERQLRPEPGPRPPPDPRPRQAPATEPPATATIAKAEVPWGRTTEPLAIPRITTEPLTTPGITTEPATTPKAPDSNATSPKTAEPVQQPADANEQFERGRNFASGRGVSRDLGEAASWYRRAADQGHPGAQVELGRMLAAGRGVTRNDVEAVKWFRAAAEGGHAAAQSELGYMYANGRGVDRNDAEAVRLYRAAAEKGHATAMNNLGWMYEKGFGVVANDAEATRWYEAAAASGNALAQNNLGRTYFLGRGVPKNDVLAAKRYRQAADQQYAPAQDNLGLLYENGRGVMRDEAEALKLYRAAAEQGYASALFNLGRMYENGRGVPKDEVEAGKWYRKSAALGFAAAVQRLTTLEKVAGK